MQRVALTEGEEASSGGLTSSCIEALARTRWWTSNREEGIQMASEGQGTAQGWGCTAADSPWHMGAHRGAGGSREKPEQGETTFYILTGYKNVSSFTEQARQDQDGIKEDVSLVLSKIQTSDNKKLNVYPYDLHTALPEYCLWQTLCLSAVPNWWSSALPAAAHQACSTIASLPLPTAKPWKPGNLRNSCPQVTQLLRGWRLWWQKHACWPSTECSKRHWGRICCPVFKHIQVRICYTTSLSL